MDININVVTVHVQPFKVERVHDEEDVGVRIPVCDREGEEAASAKQNALR